jgi:DegV family protein with EDD domain
VVSIRDGSRLKVHMHVEDIDAAREALERLGEVVRWTWDDFARQTGLAAEPGGRGRVHVMTDGAASVSRDDAEALGVTLLDNYLTLGGVSVPESRVSPEDEYAAIRHKTPVGTSQASVFERHRHYERITGHYENVVYLCVGAAYTGNHDVASTWAASHPLGGHLAVVDSGAASGRLAVVVWATARRARAGEPRAAVEAFARAALAHAEEYIFPEKLEYLARSGRVSNAGALLADLIHLAPVISPMPDGARRVATVHRTEDRIAFACERIARAFAPTRGRGLVLLQHTDNRAWVQAQLAPRVRDRFPDAECHVRPFSGTAGAHTGPGTWAVALLPGEGR